MIKKQFYVSTLKETVKSGKIQKKIYNKPKLYTNVTISPANGNTETQAYGERVFKMYKIMLNTCDLGDINEGDMVYLFKEPNENYENSEDSNYKVSSVRVSNIKTCIYVEKRL